MNTDKKMVELRRTVSHLSRRKESSQPNALSNSNPSSPLLGSTGTCSRAHIHSPLFSRRSDFALKMDESLTSSLLSGTSSNSWMPANFRHPEQRTEANDLSDLSSTNSSPQHYRALSPESDTSSSSSEANSLIDRMTRNFIDRPSIPRGLKTRVLYDFVAQGTNELTVYRGETVRTLYHVEYRWIFVVNKDGQFGYIPYLYVTKHDPTCQRRVPSLEKYRLDYPIDEEMESSISAIPAIYHSGQHNPAQTVSSVSKRSSTRKNKEQLEKQSPTTVIRRAVDKLSEDIDKNRDSGSCDSGNFDGSSNSSSNSVTADVSNFVTQDIPELPVSSGKHRTKVQVHQDPVQRPAQLRLESTHKPRSAAAIRQQNNESQQAAKKNNAVKTIEQTGDHESPLCTCPHPSYEIWKRRSSVEEAEISGAASHSQTCVHNCTSSEERLRLPQMSDSPRLLHSRQIIIPQNFPFPDSSQRNGKKVTFSKDNEIIGFADNIDRVPYSTTTVEKDTTSAQKTPVTADTLLCHRLAESRGDAISFYGDYIPHQSEDVEQTHSSTESNHKKHKIAELNQTTLNGSPPITDSELYQTVQHDDPESSIDKYTLV